jgi:hypothetical protein
MHTASIIRVMIALLIEAVCIPETFIYFSEATLLYNLKGSHPQETVFEDDLLGPG